MSSSPVRAATDGLYYFNGSPLLVQTAVIATSSSGSTLIVAAVAGRVIRALSDRVMANGTVNVKWKSNTTDICGLAYLVANTGYVDPFNPVGWFETAAGEALNIDLSAAVAVGGVLRYVVLPA